MQGFHGRLMGTQIWKIAMAGTSSSTFIFSAKWASWLLLESSETQRQRPKLNYIILPENKTSRYNILPLKNIKNSYNINNK